MSDSKDIERFVKDPGLLVELCQDVIDQIDTNSEDALVTEQEAQLRAIAKAVDQLEKSGVPVPDSLRSEKTRLVASLATYTENRQVLAQLADEFQDVLKDLRERLGLNGASSEGKPRAKRSKLPKTSKEDLRELIIKSLKSRDGRASVADVKTDLAAYLNGKLLPGDVEYRQDGKTVAWLNNAQWERLRMCQEGVLRNDSKQGVWELNKAQS